MSLTSREWLLSSVLALWSVFVLNGQTLSEEPAKKTVGAAGKIEDYDWKPFVPGSDLDYPWGGGQRQRFIATDQRNADFSGRNLLGYTFNNVDLQGANFDGADLRHAVFAYNTKLKDASFRGADLRRVRFIDSDGLTADNDITDALINDTFRIDWQIPRFVLILTEKQLRSTKSFKDQNLSHCALAIHGAPALDLRHFDLRDIRIQMDFSNCRMEGADLSRSTILPTSTISQEQIRSTSQWAGADFRWAGSELAIYCRIEGLKFGSHERLNSLAFNPEGADLTGASWDTHGPGLSDYFRPFGNVTFLEGTLTKKQLYSTVNYKRKNLRAVGFRGLKDDDWDFSGQDLTDAVFREARGISVLSLPRADFTDAIVTRTTVDLTPEQFKSTWNYKKGIFGGVSLGKKDRAELEKLRSERMKARDLGSDLE